MMLGLSLHAFTIFHVAISLIGILAGVAFFIGVMGRQWNGAANAVFLIFTILTSVTGFLFPPKPIGPPFILGVISLVVLAIALFALLAKQGIGAWRRVYLGAALLAQWFNMLVLVVQSYQKIPALHALAPTGTGPAFLATQALVAILIAIAGWTTLRQRG